MKTWKIFIILICVILPVIQALDMCKDSVRIHTNCTMVTPSILCTSYNYSIYDLNGTLREQSNLTYLNSSLYYFNFTLQEGYYIIELCDGTTREVYVEPKEGNEMIIGVIVLSPLLLAFLLMIIAYSLGKDHVAIKYSLMFLSLICVFVCWHFGYIAVAEFYGFQQLLETIGDTTYWFSIIFGMIITYFILYFIIYMVASVIKKKKEKFQY